MSAIYAILLTLCLALYALIDVSGVDKSLASNLLVWSATIFAPIALLMTYDSWRGQKASEVIANEAKELIIKLDKYYVSCSELRAFKLNINIFKEKYIEEAYKNHTLYESLYESIIFLSYLIDDKEVDGFIKTISLNHAKITVINFGIEKEKSGEIEKYLNETIASCNNIKRIITSYALYQKKLYLSNNK